MKIKYTISTHPQNPRNQKVFFADNLKDSMIVYKKWNEFNPVITESKTGRVIK